MTGKTRLGRDRLLVEQRKHLDVAFFIRHESSEIDPRLGGRRNARQHVAQELRAFLRMSRQPQEDGKIGRRPHMPRIDIKGLAHRHLGPVDVVAAIAHDPEIDPGVGEVRIALHGRGERIFGSIEFAASEPCQPHHVIGLR